MLMSDGLIPYMWPMILHGPHLSGIGLLPLRDCHYVLLSSKSFSFAASISSHCPTQSSDPVLLSIRCDPGWEGLHCERCVRMPGCQHGSCHQPWQCICHSGWAGKFCDKGMGVKRVAVSLGNRCLLGEHPSIFIEYLLCPANPQIHGISSV